MNKTTKALINSKHHANLDSLSFRYGYYFKEDTQLILFNCTEIKDKNLRDLHEKYAVRASFKLPNSDKILQGQFVLMRSDNNLVTVIREGLAFKVEELLSETLRKLREVGDIFPDDNVEMYHKGVKSTVDVVRYLSAKIGFKKVEEAQEDAKKKIDNLSKALQKTNIRVKKAEQENEYLTGVVINSELEKEEAIELAEVEKVRHEKTLKEKDDIIQNLLQRDLSQPTKEYPGIDWTKSTSTSAAFDYWEERGDFLYIYLMGKAKPIRLKNTHVYDYPVALKAVKKLLKGEIFDYSTKGIGSFAADEWFTKIIRSDGYTSFEYPGLEVTFDDIPSWVIERNHLGSFSKEEVERVVNTQPHLINSDKIREANWLSVFSQLEEKRNTSATTFKVIAFERFSGTAFSIYGHIWREDMLVLHTDKGSFVDTTIRDHGGTEWEEGVTYRNCKVSMTKGKYLPYWLQK